MNIKIERTAHGLFRATSDDGLFQITGKSVPMALRRVADFMDEIVMTDDLPETPEAQKER